MSRPFKTAEEAWKFFELHNVDVAQSMKEDAGDKAVIRVLLCIPIAEAIVAVGAFVLASLIHNANFGFGYYFKLLQPFVLMGICIAIAQAVITYRKWTAPEYIRTHILEYAEYFMKHHPDRCE